MSQMIWLAYCDTHQLVWPCIRGNQPGVEGHRAWPLAPGIVGRPPLVTFIVQLKWRLVSFRAGQSENSCKGKSAIFQRVLKYVFCVVDTHTHTHVYLLPLCWCSPCKWPELLLPLSGNALSDKCFVGALFAAWCVWHWLPFNISWHLIRLICFLKIQKKN